MASKMYIGSTEGKKVLNPVNYHIHHHHSGIVMDTELPDRFYSIRDYLENNRPQIK